MVLFQENGDLAGYYPLWRSPDQKPFTREDMGFLKASAPHIAHGLRVDWSAVLHVGLCGTALAAFVTTGRLTFVIP